MKPNVLKNTVQLHALAITVLTSFSISTAAYAASVSDGDFSAWSSFYFVTDDPYVANPGPNTSSGTATRVSTGGNPDSYLQVLHTFTTGDTIWTGGIKNDYTYNPAIDGAIGTLSVTADIRQITNLGSTAWQLVVEQGGNVIILTRLVNCPEVTGCLFLLLT